MSERPTDPTDVEQRLRRSAAFWTCHDVERAKQLRGAADEIEALRAHVRTLADELERYHSIQAYSPDSLRRVMAPVLAARAALGEGESR